MVSKQYDAEFCNFCNKPKGDTWCVESFHTIYQVNLFLAKVGYDYSGIKLWWENVHSDGHTCLGHAPKFLWETADSEEQACYYGNGIPGSVFSLRNRVAYLARQELNKYEERKKKNSAPVKENASTKHISLEKVFCCFCMVKDNPVSCKSDKHTKETLNDVLLDSFLEVDELDEWWNTPYIIDPYDDKASSEFMTPAQYWKSCNQFTLARWVRKITQ